MKLMLVGLGLEGLFLFIRSVYRTIVSTISLSPFSFVNICAFQELADGWTGRIITTQVYFSKSTSIHPSPTA